MTRPVAGMLRRALAPIAAAVLFGVQPAGAVSGPATPTGLIAQFLHDLPDNTKNLITPALLRADLGYIVNSMAYLLQAGPGQILIGSSASALTPRTVAGDCALSSSGAILCTKTNGVAFAASATTDTTNAANISSGTLPAARLPGFTGDVTTSAGSSATTLATVNANVGTFGDATHAGVVTINGKGLTTAASSVTITPPFSAVTGQATLAQLPNLAATTFLCNATAGSAVPTACNPSTSRTALGLATVASSGSAGDLTTGTLPAARLQDNSTVIGNAATFWSPTYFGNPGTANIYRLARLFLGASTASGGNNPISPTIWIDTVFGAATTNSTLVATNPLGGSGITGAARTSDFALWTSGFDGGAQGVNGFALNDDTRTGGTSFAAGMNAVGAQATGTIGVTEGIQAEAWSQVTPSLITPFGGVHGQALIAVNATCGTAGYTSNCSAALNIGTRAGTVFENGITFGSAALDSARGSGGNGVAIDAYTGQSYRWLNSSDTTVAEIWGAADGLHSSTPIKSPNSSYVLAASFVAVPLTGSTAEVAAATITIPANAMGPNGFLTITTYWSATNNANAKSIRTRLGGLAGTAYALLPLTSLATLKSQQTIANRGAANSQIGNASGISAGGWGGTSGAFVTGAIDTTVTQTLVLTAQLATSTDTVTLEGYIVTLTNGP